MNNGDAWTWGLAPKMSLSPHRETHWSRIGGEVWEIFKFLIITAVKICKQYPRKLLHLLGDPLYRTPHPRRYSPPAPPSFIYRVYYRQ